jgi:predicted anti-sigma-YlaC factor YlaD
MRMHGSHVMSNHVKADLPAYFNNDLPEAKKQQVDAHLEECSSCRQTADKIRSKSSQGKRDALKGAAAPERVPNLLLTRLGRQNYETPRANSTPWAAILFAAVLLFVGAWAVHRSARWKAWRAMGLAHFSSPAVVGSTAAASGFEVENSSAAAAQTAPMAAAPATNVSTAPATAVPVVPAAAMPTVAPPTGQWGGDDSEIRESREVVLRGRAAWRSLWREMGKTDEVPHVNFNEFVVIGFFAGERPAGQYQVSFGAPIDQDDAITIPYKISGPFANAASGNAPVHPYLLTTVQRSPKPIHFHAEGE